MSKLKEDDNERQLLTEKRRYPEVFKWKVAVIVIIVLLAIFLVVDILMTVYLSNHTLRNTNYSFAAQIINLLSGTNITREQFTNLMGGLTISYSEIWFQNASKAGGWNSGDPNNYLNLQKAAQIFSTKVTDRLTIVRFTDEKTVFVVGAYTHIPFQVPTNDWKEFLSNSSNSYYNFEISEQESTLVGSNSPIYLKMEDINVTNLLNCKIMSLSSTQWNLLGAVNIILNSQSNPGQAYLQLLSLPSDSTQCFSSNAQQADFLQRLKLAVGPTMSTTTKYRIMDIYSYSLTT